MLRCHMGSTILMAHLWIRYLGFITGMIMAVLGAVFILGKLRESSAPRLGADSGLKLSLSSASPGVVVALLGCILMVTTVLTQQQTQVQKVPLYRPFGAGRRSATQPLEVPEFFRGRHRARPRKDPNETFGGGALNSRRSRECSWKRSSCRRRRDSPAHYATAESARSFYHARTAAMV